MLNGKIIKSAKTTRTNEGVVSGVKFTFTDGTTFMAKLDKEWENVRFTTTQGITTEEGKTRVTHHNRENIFDKEYRL